MDPSKMNPAVLAELSSLIQELPPQKLSEMQSIMHNSMAGFDTTQKMQEFEASLPQGFREKLAKLMYQAHGSIPTETSASNDTIEVDKIKEVADSKAEELSVDSARIVVLRAVANGSISPEEAEKILFQTTH